MSSNLRVNSIVPATGTNVAIGTAGGTITYNASVSGVSTFTTINATSIIGISTLGVTTAYINTLSGISTISADSSVYINQNLVFPSGKGIDFSATANSSGTMTSELLADYEEGTWTPVMYGTSVAGTWSPDSNNGGRYIKIGRQVTAWFNANGSLSGASGTTRISGLPFATASNTGASKNSVYSSGSFQYWSGIGVQVIAPLTEPNSTNMYFHTYQANSSQGPSPNVVNGSHNLHAFVTYFVD